MNGEKIIVILGTTASGKTSLAVKIANKYNGEIVSADSRQVYKDMDIGTGKDLSEYKVGNKKIKYHLIDVVSPKTEYNLAKYQKAASRAIDDILSRGKMPIVTGGTSLYIQAIIDGYRLSGAKPIKKLRKKLEKMDVENLFLTLKKIDPEKAKSLNESDNKNKRRLIRYIEISKTPKNIKEGEAVSKYSSLLIGLTHSKEMLEKRIYKRIIERLENENMIEEVNKLRKKGITWKRLDGFGLEYRFISMYLRNKLTYEEMVEKLHIAIRQFAKKQMTWFKKDKRIKWVNNKTEAEKLINKFLK